MSRTQTEIIDAVLVKNNITTSATGKFTDQIMRGWLDLAHKWATARHKTPLTEGRISTTFTGLEEVPYPEGWKSDSIRYMEIGGIRFDKTLFQDYKDYRQNYPSGADEIFTDFARTIFVNTGAAASGSLVAYGQYTPTTIDGTDEDALTVFSDADQEGNEAIIEEMSRYVRQRERKADEAEVHHQNAIRILDGLYGHIGGEQFGYKPKDSEMFKQIDVLSGQDHDDRIRRNRFY